MFPVVQVVTFKNNGHSKTHFMLPDITRTNLTVWKDIRDGVLIPLDGRQTFKGKVPRRSCIFSFVEYSGFLEPPGETEIGSRNRRVREIGGKITVFD